MTDTPRTCYICKGKNNLKFSHNATHRDKDTGKGGSTPLYDCGPCRGSIKKEIRRVLHNAEGMPVATKLSIMG